MDYVRLALVNIQKVSPKQSHQSRFFLYFFTIYSITETPFIKCPRKLREQNSTKLSLFLRAYSQIVVAAFPFKAGFHLKAVFMSFNVAFVPISRSRFKQWQIAPLRTFTNVLRFCVNFWMIFGHSVNEIFFSKDRLN